MWKSIYIIVYTMKKILATILADTCATKYGFINEEFAEKVWQTLEIKL